MSALSLSQFEPDELKFFFQQLWEKSLNPFWVCKPVGDDFEIVMVNPAAQRLNPQQVPGSRFSKLIDRPGYSKRLTQGYYDCMKTKQPLEFEQRPVRDGKEFVYRTFLVPVMDDNNEVTHIWGTAHNLTDFLDPQKELLAINQMLDARVKERTAQLNVAMAKLEKLSVTDDLTELANRRYFDRELEKEVRRAQRSNQPLALIYFDIDHFKDYNDTYGHREGDECLCRIAHVLAEQASRAADVVARYGGEEFVMLLPGLDNQDALQFAERVRVAIEQLAVPHKAAPRGIVTVSAGVAALRGSEVSADQLLKLADDALYRSKEAGRNASLIATTDV